MAYPVDKRTAAYNTNKHDAFGHDCVDEIGIKNARQVPHSGSDFGGKGPIFSIAGGKIVKSGWSNMAGWYAIEDSGYGIFFVYFHAVSPMKAQNEYTEPGETIGYIGNTGSGSHGAHLHVSAALSLFAAVMLVTIGTYRRGNRTSAQWAADHGLTDPMPYIYDETLRPVRPPVPEPEPEVTNEFGVNMATFIDKNNTVVWGDDWIQSYPPGVYLALRYGLRDGVRDGNMPDYIYGTVVREVWAIQQKRGEAMARAVGKEFKKTAVPASVPAAATDAQLQAFVSERALSTV